MFDTAWTPSSWRERPAAQQPEWPEPAEVDAGLAALRRQPPLVFAGEARQLTASLAAVARGEVERLVQASAALLERLAREVGAAG